MSQQRCADVQTMLCECISTKIPTLPQHCDNIQAILCECCGNVMLNIRDWCWDNIQAMLCEHCLNVGAQPCTWLLYLRNDSHIQIGTFYTLAISTCISTLAQSHLQTFMSNPTYHASWVDRQMMNFQEISSGTPHSSVWM